MSFNPATTSSGSSTGTFGMTIPLATDLFALPYAHNYAIIMTNLMRGDYNAAYKTNNGPTQYK